MDQNNLVEQEEEFEQQDEDYKEPTAREIAWRYVRRIVALVVILGMLYISGVYQFLFYQKTAPNITQESVESALDVEAINIPLTILILKNSEELGSQRTKEDVIRLVDNASEIWKQANIQLHIQDIFILDIKDSEIEVFFETPRLFINSIEEYNSETINVFLTKTLNGINGIAFGGTNSVAVADYTSVYDFRALAHEVGHILGLIHIQNSGKLMHQGANGFELSLEEIMRAREFALRF